MPASQIFVIRHGEKPTSGESGILPSGEDDPESLVVQGWQRAGALGRLFFPHPLGSVRPGLATPETLFASAIAHPNDSKRSQQTLSVLSGLSPALNTNYDFPRNQEVEMAKAAIATEGIVLICWDHARIPSIANTILGDEKTAPQAWPADSFDLVWIFQRESPTATWKFSQLPQLLLPGDTETVLF